MPQRSLYPDGVKTCVGCEETKPLDAFYKVKARNGTPTGRCKACASKHRPRYQRKLAARIVTCAQCGSEFTPKKRPDRARYCTRACAQLGWSRSRGVRPTRIVIVDGRKQCTQCKDWKTLDQFARRKDRDNKPVSHCKSCGAAAAKVYNGGERGRNKRYANKYGVTIEWYEARLIEQSGGCAICGNPPDSGSKMHPRLAIDHDHRSGTPRALLCFICNSAIGKFHDDPALLRRAADYLELHRSQLA